MHVIQTMGTVSLATGLGQVAFTSVIGYAICLALGLSHLTSVCVAVALTFSSTIIIIKLLSDYRKTDYTQFQPNAFLDSDAVLFASRFLWRF